MRSRKERVCLGRPGEDERFSPRAGSSIGKIAQERKMMRTDQWEKFIGQILKPLNVRWGISNILNLLLSFTHWPPK